MSIAAERLAGRSVPAFLTLGFRPFFLAAAVWSAAALALWITILASGGVLPSRFDPLTWHIHEMLFGFVMAAIAGFLLTAIPNWTGRLPDPRAAARPSLAGLWLLGRIACLISALMPAWLAAAADLAFPAALAVVDRARDRRRPELAQPADGGPGDRSRDCRSLDAARSGRHRRAHSMDSRLTPMAALSAPRLLLWLGSGSALRRPLGITIRRRFTLSPPCRAL